MQTINLLGVYGAGNDALFGAALRSLIAAIQADAKANGYEKYLYVPRIVDWTEQSTTIRLMQKWKDPTVVLCHSCGCQTGTMGSVEDSMSPVPFIACMAPSMYCKPVPVANNVGRIVQFSSWAIDGFNPFSRQLISLTGANNKTKLDVISTGYSHLLVPNAPIVHKTCIAEVRKAVGVKL